MTKKILICFDGTGNEMGVSEDDSLSNIAKIAIRAGWRGNNDECSLLDQKVLYYSGPGTRGICISKFIGKYLSPERKIGKIIKFALKNLCKTYEKGDEIAIIGFSRGAAIARRFASLLKKEISEEIRVKILGCFDTVAQIGMPDMSEYPDDEVLFENNGVSKIVKQAYHCVSINEDRKLFPPTLMDHDERVCEIWFCGVHSDIGGGYPEHGLSDIPLEYLVKKLNNSGFQVLEPSKVGTLPEGVEAIDIVSSPSDFDPSHVHNFAYRTPRKVHKIDNGKPNADHKVTVHISVQNRIKASPSYKSQHFTSRWEFSSE